MDPHDRSYSPVGFYPAYQAEKLEVVTRQSVTAREMGEMVMFIVQSEDFRNDPLDAPIPFRMNLNSATPIGNEAAEAAALAVNQ